MDLRKLNSATKYPSIPTYHELDPKTGRLIEDAAMPFYGNAVLTEKVDGTNGRVIVMPDGDWYIGSREEILYACGDRIVNPAMSIVPALLPLAPELAALTGNIRVYFLEVYGRGIGSAAKQYASVPDLTGYRLFDVALTDPLVLDWDLAKIASWRDHEGQLFLSEGNLTADANLYGIPLTPRLGEVPAPDLPVNLAGMQAFMHKHLPVSRALLDEGAGGLPEGIVLRTRDRGVITKARFADYARTLAPPQKKGR